MAEYTTDNDSSLIIALGNKEGLMLLKRSTLQGESELYLSAW